MSIASFNNWWDSLSALEQYILKDRKLDMLIQEAIKSKELSIEFGPIRFSGFVPIDEKKDKYLGRLEGSFKIRRHKVDE